MKKSVFLHTLGCAKNEADSLGMQNLIRQAGYRIVSQADEADALVINTCGFIGPAVEESVAAIVDATMYKEEKASRQVIVTGCLVSRQYRELREALPEVDVFLGTASFHKINRALQGREKDRPDSERYLFDVSVDLQADSHYGLVKIGEGCSRQCSFCTIPGFRGRHQSRSSIRILDELKRIADAGIKEAILLAQDSTQYGMDLKDETGLIGLLELMDRQQEFLPDRVRLHYTYPGKLIRELVPLLAESSVLCSYLDLPLQHTDPALLKNMRRPVDSEDTLLWLRQCRDNYPDLWMRTTVLLGYPGETDATVEKLRDDLLATGFEYLSVFPWYREEGTEAARQGDEPEQEQLAGWLQLLSETQEEMEQEHLGARLGTLQEVLIEEAVRDEKDLWQGRTVGQSPDVDGVTFVRGQVASHDLVRVRIDDMVGGDLYGQIENTRLIMPTNLSGKLSD